MVQLIMYGPNEFGHAFFYVDDPDPLECEAMVRRGPSGVCLKDVVVSARRLSVRELSDLVAKVAA